MFYLFSHQPNAILGMKERFGSYICETGKAYVTDNDKLQNPVDFISGLFALKKKYDLILEKSFSDDAEFKKTLYSSIESFVNGNVQRRLAEYLSLFLDYTIRNTKGVNDRDTEEAFENAMVFFRFLQDKDVFESYYKIHLSRRLLMSKSDKDQTQDAEKSFIQKLKVKNKFKKFY